MVYRRCVGICLLLLLIFEKHVLVCPVCNIPHWFVAGHGRVDGGGGQDERRARGRVNQLQPFLLHRVAARRCRAEFHLGDEDPFVLEAHAEVGRGRGKAGAEPDDIETGLQGGPVDRQFQPRTRRLR